MKFPDVELVPAWINNVQRVMPKGEVVPVPVLCSVTFGVPMRILPGEERHDFLTEHAPLWWPCVTSDRQPNHVQSPEKPEPQPSRLVPCSSLCLACCCWPALWCFCCPCANPKTPTLSPSAQLRHREPEPPAQNQLAHDFCLLGGLDLR
jgi:hypothetical protein